MAMFNCYVSSPEGTNNLATEIFFHGKICYFKDLESTDLTLIESEFRPQGHARTTKLGSHDSFVERGDQ